MPTTQWDSVGPQEIFARTIQYHRFENDLRSIHFGNEVEEIQIWAARLLLSPLVSAATYRGDNGGFQPCRVPATETTLRHLPPHSATHIARAVVPRGRTCKTPPPALCFPQGPRFP